MLNGIQNNRICSQKRLKIQKEKANINENNKIENTGIKLDIIATAQRRKDHCGPKNWFA